MNIILGLVLKEENITIQNTSERGDIHDNLFMSQSLSDSHLSLIGPHSRAADHFIFIFHCGKK